MKENIILSKNGIMINVDVSVKKNNTYVNKIVLGILLHDKYLECIIDDDSVITCDEFVEETKTIETNFNEKSSL